MLNTIRKMISASVLGLSMSVFSTTALSAGPVTFLWYEAGFYTLLVTADGKSCGWQTQNIAPEKIAGSVSMLAIAKATGRNVNVSCSGGNSFQITLL